MTEDAAQRRRWVKSWTTTSASIAQSFARPVQVRDTHHSIHPREILTSARDRWSEIWRAVPTDEGTLDTNGCYPQGFPCQMPARHLLQRDAGYGVHYTHRTWTTTRLSILAFVRSIVHVVLSHFVRDAHVSLRAVSFVDDRSFWCKVAGDRAETIAWLLEAKRRSDAFDGCCGFQCRPSKCHVASADVDLAFTAGQAMGYLASNFLELLGVGIDLTTGVCKLQSVSREALKARLRAIACLHCNPLDRAQLIRNLVITSMTWTAGIAVLGEDELVQLRGEVLSAFNPKACVDVPPVVSLELLGWCSDPVCASWRMALKALIVSMFSGGDGWNLLDWMWALRTGHASFLRPLRSYSSLGGGPRMRASLSLAVRLLPPTCSSEVHPRHQVSSQT